MMRFSYPTKPCSWCERQCPIIDLAYHIYVIEDLYANTGEVYPQLCPECASEAATRDCVSAALGAFFWSRKGELEALRTQHKLAESF